MNKRTIKILAFVFLLLFIIAGYPFWQSKIKLGKKEKKYEEINFVQFNKDNTDKVIIKSKSEEVQLVKKENQWNVNDYPASQQQIESFFNSLANAEIETLASKNPDNQASFDISADNGVMLTLTGRFGEAIYLIGKTGPDYNSFYASLKDSNNIYLVKGDLKQKLITTSSRWRDKTVVNISQEKIAKIEVSGKSQFSISKNKEGKWEIDKAGVKKILEDDKSTNILSRFSPLDADSFLTDNEAKEFNLAREKTTVKIFDSESKILAELILIEKNSDWWVGLPNKEEKYLIYSYRLGPLFDPEKEKN